jgi:hypothetical protein
MRPRVIRQMILGQTESAIRSPALLSVYHTRLRCRALCPGRCSCGYGVRWRPVLPPCRVGGGTSGGRVAACATSVPAYGAHDGGWGSQLRCAGCDVLGQLVVVKACLAYFPEAGIVLCLARGHLVCGRRPGRAIPGPLSRRCCPDAAGAAAWRGRSFRGRGAPSDSARPPVRRAGGRARWPSRRPRRSPARPAGT